MLISASMKDCRVPGSSRMWRKMADMWGSRLLMKHALGKSNMSFRPLPANTCAGSIQGVRGVLAAFASLQRAAPWLAEVTSTKPAAGGSPLHQLLGCSFVFVF